MKADPSGLSFNYDQILRRTQQVCKGDSPVGSAVSSSLGHMADIAKTVQPAQVLDWDENVLDIVEPYFIFYLRNSTQLARLAQATTAQPSLDLKP
jgi:hypothetical protein